MTTQPAGPELPPVDVGNPLLAPTQAILGTTIVNTPQGRALVMTIRTPSTTLTIHLAEVDAKAWAQALSEAAAKMSGGIIIAQGALPQMPPGPQAPLNGGGH